MHQIQTWYISIKSFKMSIIGKTSIGIKFVLANYSAKL